jgi:hypothetical protein
MTPVPTTKDWIDNADAALASSLEIAKATAAHGDPTTQSIALGLLARATAAAAPIIGQAIGGPLGAMAGAVVAQAAAEFTKQQENAVKALTPDQLAIVDAAIQAGAQAITRKDSRP